MIKVDIIFAHHIVIPGCARQNWAAQTDEVILV
jgi:hypothetical protein